MKRFCDSCLLNGEMRPGKVEIDGSRLCLLHALAVLNIKNDGYERELLDCEQEERD